MAGKLKPLEVERETKPGKYADGDGLYLRTHSTCGAGSTGSTASGQRGTAHRPPASNTHHWRDNVGAAGRDDVAAMPGQGRARSICVAGGPSRTHSRFRWTSAAQP